MAEEEFPQLKSTEKQTVSQDSVAQTQTSLKKAFAELKPGQKRFRKLRDSLVHDPDKSAQVELKSTCFCCANSKPCRFQTRRQYLLSVSAALRLLFHVPASEKFSGRRQCFCEQNVCPSSRCWQRFLFRTWLLEQYTSTD